MRWVPLAPSPPGYPPAGAATSSPPAPARPFPKPLPLNGPTTDSVPLYRCRLASRPDGFEAGDHFDSLQADCEGNPSDGIVGWILPAPATTPPPPPPAPTPAYKSAVLGHTCNAWRGLLLQIKAPNGPVPAGTTWKVSKSDIQPIALTTIPDHPDISVEVIDYRNLKVIAKAGPATEHRREPAHLQLLDPQHLLRPADGRVHRGNQPLRRLPARHLVVHR